MAGPMVGPLLATARARPRRDLLGAGRQLPRPRAQPAAAREPPVHHRQGPRDRRRPRHRLGRRRRPLLLHRRHRASSSTATSSPRSSPSTCSARQPGADILYDARASRAVADTVTAGRRHAAHQPRRPRVLQDPHARRGRDLRRRGLRPLLLPRLLQRRLRHDPGAADPREARRSRARSSASCSRPTAPSTSSRARSTPRSATRRRKMAEIEERYGAHAGAIVTHVDGVLGRLRRLALQRAPVEHRAAAAPDARVARLARRTWRPSATRCSALIRA